MDQHTWGKGLIHSTKHRKDNQLQSLEPAKPVEYPSWEYKSDRKESGGRLNKKDGLTRCGDSHVKDKTSYRPSYL